MLWTMTGLDTITTLAAAAMLAAGPVDTTVSPAKRGDDGILVHTVRSPFQSGSTEIRVLLPDTLEKDRRYRVLYVLPVEAQQHSRYGKGLAEVEQLDLHIKHNLICVEPTFSHLPWYADHPSDPEIRQETYLLKVVLPLIERSYPVLAEQKGRLLVGFSKSGWGAWTLLLRHPKTFWAAAAWDSPMMQERPNRFGMGPIFGTQENFEPYRVTRLLDRQADALKKRRRLILLGYGAFRDHHQRIHAQLEELDIPHIYRDGPKRRHHWSGGWLAEAVELVAEVR